MKASGEGVLRAGLPGWQYHDPAHFELERNRILETSWHVVATTDELTEPGNCVVAEIADTPIAVVRGETGKLHAFVNACRHRGHPVACGSSRAERGSHKRTLRCPYHGWTYSLDGRLIAAAGCGRLEERAVGLAPVAVDEWRRLVFANLAVDAPGLTTVMPQLEKLAQAEDMDLAGYTYFGRSEAIVRCNWKAWLENTHECYHCSTIHQNSFAASWDVRRESYRFVCDGQVIGQFARPRLTSFSGGSSGRALRQVFIWPTSALSIDGLLAFVIAVEPLDAGRTRVRTITYVADTASARAVREWLAMYQQTYDEDVAAVEASTAGLRAQGVHETLVMPEVEPGVAHFHWLARRALAGANPSAT